MVYRYIISIFNNNNKTHVSILATSDDWKNMECGFRTQWNFPGCVGTLDGKYTRIVIRVPPGSGSDYYNYKNSYRIVLLALVDSDYCFLYVMLELKEEDQTEVCFKIALCITLSKQTFFQYQQISLFWRTIHFI